MVHDQSGTRQSPAQPPAAVPAMAVLLHPTTLLLVAANAVPIFGVLYWGWDAFLLLMLYWMESAIIGFWTIARIAAAPNGAMGPLLINGHPATNSSLAVAAFFVVHAGMFMGVHFAFLWAFFSGNWASKVDGPADFLNQIVIASGLWVPLLVMFVSRGASFVFHALKPDLIRRLEQRLPLRGLPPPRADDSGIIGSFYCRVVIMQMAIVFGGFIASLLGSLAPLLILVVLKTALDVVLHAAIDFGVSLRKTVPAAALARSSGATP
jgi:hypothetical protein